MLDQVKRLRKLATEREQLEESIIKDLGDNHGVDEDLFDVIDVILENISAFDSSETAMNTILSLGKKKATGGHKKKGRKEEVKNE